MWVRQIILDLVPLTLQLVPVCWTGFQVTAKGWWLIICVSEATLYKALQKAASGHLTSMAAAQPRVKVHKNKTTLSLNCWLTFDASVGRVPSSTRRDGACSEHVQSMLFASGYQSAAGNVSFLRLEFSFRGHTLDAPAVEYAKRLRRASIGDFGEPKHGELVTYTLQVALAKAARKSGDASVACFELTAVCWRPRCCCVVMSSFTSTRRMRESSFTPVRCSRSSGRKAYLPGVDR